MRAPALISLLGVAGALLLACSDSAGTGVTVSGKSVNGGRSRTFTTLSDEGGAKRVGCELAAEADPVRVEASLDETDEDISFELVLAFDGETLAVDEAALTLAEDGVVNVGDDCSAEVTSHIAGGFAASLTCPTSNGGSGPMLSLEVDYQFCQVTRSP